MSSVIVPNHFDNVLSCGYLREYEFKNQIIIPHTVQSIIVMYCKQNKLCGIGWPIQNSKLATINKLISNTTNSIFANEYGINVKSISNELYITDNNLNKLHIINTSSLIASTAKVHLTSSGVANNKDLFIYTSNNLLYKSKVQNNNKLYNNNIDTKICSEFQPINISFISNTYNDTIIDIKCGLNHTLFLTQLGNVYSYGLNDVGQCGFNQNKYPNISVPKLMMKSILAIACGSFHNLLVSSKYELMVCGYNYVGQLGIQQQLNETEFDILTSESEYNEEKNEHQHNNNNNNNIFCGSFQFADTSEDSDEETLNTLSVDVPMVNKYFTDLNVKIVKVYAGKFHSLCITSNGKCYTFGQNAFGNLGNGKTTEWGLSNPIPQQIKPAFESFIVTAACGQNHNILLDKKNNIISFGDNSNNQCSIINQNNIIKNPFMLDKEKEFGVNQNCFVEKIICLKNESLIFIDPYKR